MTHFEFCRPCARRGNYHTAMMARRRPQRSLQLRQATRLDARAIANWFATRQEAVNWGGSQTPFPVDADWLAEEFFNNTSRTYYVLADEIDRPCGTYNLWRPDEERLHIGRFAVDPSLRRMGVGRRMIEEAAHIARSHGATTLIVRVYEHNLVARRMYERVGFKRSVALFSEHGRAGNIVTLEMTVQISN
jgi:ribosomal protein S18 acetylase RimI-like enzyme